jgi:hypothetical protein
MSIASWWKNIKETPAKNWYYSRIPDDQTPKDIDSTPPQANEAYLDIHMKSMCIVNVRNGFSTFYPAIHSFISLDYIGNSKAEFNYVTTPGNLEQLDSAHIDRVININKRLLGPVPYRGGDVELEIGLFSVKSANLAAPFISLLTNMSEIAGVSFIGKVLPFADPISKGVDLLVGNSDNAELEIGLSTHMKQIQTGYYVAMGCDKSKVKEEDLFIDKRDYKLIDKNGNAIREYPYMVISISHSNRKDDWLQEATRGY